MLAMCCLKLKAAIQCEDRHQGIKVWVNRGSNSMLCPGYWSDCSEQLWRAKLEIVMKRLKKVAGQLAMRWFMLSIWFSEFRLLPGLWFSGKQLLLSPCLLGAVSSLKGWLGAVLSLFGVVSSLISHLILHCSLLPVLLQRWLGLDSACSAVEVLPGEGPHVLQSKNPNPTVVVSIAIELLRPTPSKHANSWTLVAQILTQHLCLPSVLPFLPLVALITNPVSMPTFRFSSLRNLRMMAMVVTTRGSTRARVQRMLRGCQRMLQSMLPTFLSIRRCRHPKGTMSTWIPILLQRKWRSMAGARWSRRSQMNICPSVQHHILQRCSGLVLAFCLCHVGSTSVLAMSALPERDIAEGFLLPLRGMNTFGPEPLRGMSSLIWLNFCGLGTPRGLFFLDMEPLRGLSF